MGKISSRSSAAGRVKQFPEEGLVSISGNLHCKFCNNLQLNYEKKSVLQSHFQSVSHLKCKSSIQQTPNISTALKTQEKTTKIWSEMVTTFVGAGVPLYIFRTQKVRGWINEHVKGGQKLPSETKLRQLLVEEGRNDFNDTVSYCRNKDVIVVPDETLDIKNRKVLNILVGPAEPKSKLRLLRTVFLEKCDAKSVAAQVIESVAEAKIPLKNVIFFKSDNVPYMTLAGSAMKSVCERLIHSTCWAHIIHLAAEEIRKELSLADKYINGMKKVLLKAPARRHEFLQKLEDHGHNRKLPPSPVTTRWCTWLQAGQFHQNNFQAEVAWINETEDNSVAVNDLKKLVSSKTIGKLKSELEKINSVGAALCPTIRKLEKRDLISSDLWLLLNTVDGVIEETLGHKSSKLVQYMSPSILHLIFGRMYNIWIHENVAWWLTQTLRIFRLA